MSRHLTTWYVIADGTHARVVARRDGRFETVTALDSAAAHLRTSELGSDKPGRVFERSGTAQHAVEPRSDPHQRSKADFAHLLAGQVTEAARRHEFDHLVLVAPPKILHDIKEHLDGTIAAKLVAEPAKDLTKLPGDELHNRLSGIKIHLP
jgi:protein required for attachment to host cells